MHYWSRYGTGTLKRAGILVSLLLLASFFSWPLASAEDFAEDNPTGVTSEAPVEVPSRQDAPSEEVPAPPTETTSTDSDKQPESPTSTPEDESEPEATTEQVDEATEPAAAIAESTAGSTEIPSPEGTETAEADDGGDSALEPRMSLLAVESIMLTANGGPGPIVVDVGEAIDLVATGLTPDAGVQSTNAFGDCTGVQRSSVSQPVPASGTYEISPALDYPVTLGFWIESEGVTSNCVIVTWASESAPELTVNGSAGPVEAPFGTLVNAVVSGLAPGAPVAVQVGEFTCYNNPATVESGVAAGDGTFATTFLVAVVIPYHLNVVSNGDNSNCVIVQGVQGSITLTGNGGFGPIVVSTGEPVDLLATGLVPDAHMRSSNFYGDCDGTSRSSVSQPVPASGTYESTWVLDYPVTLGIVVESNGVSSNCVIVTWENDAAPVLAANGSAGPVEVPVGSVANLEVSGLVPGSAVSIEQGEFTCYNNTTVLETGTATSDGTFSTTYRVESLGTAFLNVRSEGVNSNCVFVQGAQGPITLTANGGPGPIVVDVGEGVDLVAAGLIPDANMTFGNSFGDCDGPGRSSIGAPALPDGTYTLNPALDYPVTLGFQVESNGIQSNCVLVTWESGTAPVLTVNGSSALHVQVVAGEPVDVMVSGLAPGAAVTFERGGFICYFPSETLAAGAAGGDGVFGTTFTPSEVGTYYLGAVSGDTRANCVIVQAVEPPPPTEEPPTEPATEQPTEQVTEEPTESTTEESTEPATEEPTEPATEEPTNPDTEPATDEPTESASSPTTGEPTVTPTEPAGWSGGSSPGGPGMAALNGMTSGDSVDGGGSGSGETEVSTLPVTGAPGTPDRSLFVLLALAAVLFAGAGSVVSRGGRRP